jgi:hypothetical protein
MQRVRGELESRGRPWSETTASINEETRHQALSINEGDASMHKRQTTLKRQTRGCGLR